MWESLRGSVREATGRTSRASNITERDMESSGMACSEAWMRPFQPIDESAKRKERRERVAYKEKGKHLFRETNRRLWSGRRFEDPTRRIRQCQPKTFFHLGEVRREKGEGWREQDLQPRGLLVSSIVSEIWRIGEGERRKEDQTFPPIDWTQGQAVGDTLEPDQTEGRYPANR
jgi:hypothetical protein